MGRGGGQAGYTRPAFLLRVGEGEARATVLVLHTLEMHVDLSFSYLRFAEAASFDKKELRRSCTSAVTEHTRNQVFFERYPTNFFFLIFTLVLLDRFLDGSSKFGFFIGEICILIRD